MFQQSLTIEEDLCDFGIVVTAPDNAPTLASVGVAPTSDKLAVESTTVDGVTMLWLTAEGTEAARDLMHTLGLMSAHLEGMLDRCQDDEPCCCRETPCNWK
jgi:hypothetical protein